MNCDQVQDLLTAYLDDEVTPSERRLLREHIAGCTACQAELGTLWKVQSQVRQTLKTQAAGVDVSPGAWDQLSGRLFTAGLEDPEPGSAEHLERRRPDKMVKQTNKSNLIGLFSAGMAAAMVIVFIVVVVAKPWNGQGSGVGDQPDASPVDEADLEDIVIPQPGERAATQCNSGNRCLAENGTYWIHAVQQGETVDSIAAAYNSNGDAIMRMNELIAEPSAGDIIRVPVNQPFKPFYLLRGLPEMDVRVHKQQAQTDHVLYYNEEGQFIDLFQQAADDDTALPEGEILMLGDHEAVLIEGFSGTVEVADPDTIVGTSGVEIDAPASFEYEDARQLTWFANGVHLYLRTNLSEEEMIALANGLVQTFDASRFTYRPTQFHTELSLDAVEDGALYRETRQFGNEEFAILTQTLAGLDDRIPYESSFILEDGTPARIEHGISGTVKLTPPDGAMPLFQDGAERDVIGGGGGGGGGPDEEPVINPETLDYEDGIRMWWIKDGVKFEIISNLPETDLLEMVMFLEAEPSITMHQQPYGPPPEPGEPVDPTLRVGDVTSRYWPTDSYWLFEITVTEDAEEITEYRLYDVDRFAVVTYKVDTGEVLPPSAEAVQINGNTIKVTRRLSGEVLLSDVHQTLQDGVERPMIGLGGGTSGDLYETAQPETIAYENGLRFEWIDDAGLLWSVLTNLPLDDAVSFIEGLEYRPVEQ